MLKLIFGSKNIKYTCACCGYKSLTTNDIGEICRLCFWEEDYGTDGDSFCISSANHMTLYQAQENYKINGCSSEKMSKHCRKPLPIEKKDSKWQSIQDNIEKKYTTPQLVEGINKYSEFLKEKKAHTIFLNFKSLNEIEIMHDDEELELNHMEFRKDIQRDKFMKELQLKSLLVALFNRNNYDVVLSLFEEYYGKGLSYYISWSIMPLILTNVKQLKLNSKIADIFLDIENNNYYGLCSLENTLKSYWSQRENCKINYDAANTNVDQFIAQYDGSQKSYIDFCWNSKHGVEFIDANQIFRRSVIEIISSKLDEVPLILIRDLYLAETKYSKEAWCVHHSVSRLAQKLLMRGGIVEFDYYCSGLKCGWDAYLAARNIHLSKDINSLFLKECQNRLEDSKFLQDKELYRELMKSFEK